MSKHEDKELRLTKIQLFQKQNQKSLNNHPRPPASTAKKIGCLDEQFWRFGITNVRMKMRENIPEER